MCYLKNNEMSGTGSSTSPFKQIIKKPGTFELWCNSEKLNKKRILTCRYFILLKDKKTFIEL